MPPRPARTLHQLLLVDFLVRLAELVALVVLPWWIARHGSASGLAAYGVVLAIGTFATLPVVAPFGDRICKARQIRWGLACMAAVAATQLVLSLAGVFALAALMALALVQVLAAAFVDPARDTLLTELVAPEHLPAAIRQRKTTQALSGILGPLLAGAALGWVGISGALGLELALLGMAALVALCLPRRSATARPHGGVATWWQELREGLAAKWRMPMERGWTLVNFVVWIFQGPAVGMLIPLKVQSLGLTGAWLGLCLGALSGGALMGSLFGSAWLVERLGRYRVRVGLGVLEGLTLATVGWATSPAWLLVGLAAAGFCNASMSLVGATHRALAVPQAYRVRMFAASSMSTQVAGALGPALVGVALAHHGVSAVYTVWGLLMAACVLGFLAVPRLKEFLTLDHAQATDWYRRQYPSVFR